MAAARGAPEIQLARQYGVVGETTGNSL